VRARAGGPGLAWLALLLAGLSAGCTAGLSSSARLADATSAAGWASVQNVPELRQSAEDGCGAAALAMVLGHWGQAVSENDIRLATSPHPGDGVRAGALRDFARGRGLEAYLVEGEVEDLHREIGRGRPVLVGVVKRHGRRTYRHYEVVVGIHRARERILTLDPARGPRESRLEDFAAEWAAADRLTLVVFPSREASVVHDAS
jgi:ABC-type bacteriocin/lantibiotic exporter with double-glycine peptidase domain